jgi:DUF1680 family protein
MSAQITLKDAFWAPRIRVDRDVTIPAMYRQLKESPRWNSLKHTWKHGDPNQPHLDWDSDIAKFVESVCCAMRHVDSKSAQHATFLSWVDEAIDMIATAQGPDGYINTYHTVVAPEDRWNNVAHNIELYDAGHLLEAAVSHYKSTQSARFLDIMKRYINYIGTIFGPEEGKLHGYPGHQEIELALFRLYEVCPEDRYFKLAQYFIEERGKGKTKFFDDEARTRGDDPETWIPPPPPGVDIPYFPKPRDYWYMQAETPIRELQKIRGHSVRTQYYLAAVQDLANITHDKTLDKAVDNLWRNMVDSKLYIHGGIGSNHLWEGFDEDYELPLDGYAETCASIGILFLGKRMLQRRLSGEIARVMERALYNNIIGGVSLDGTSFFYNQPLSTDKMARSNWFEVCCCPPNLGRLLNSLEEYVFTTKGSLVALNLYIGAEYKSDNVKINVSTTYPWEGKVEIYLQSQCEVAFAIREPEQPYQISTESNVVDGYIHYDPRIWNTTIVLSINISPRVIESHPMVQATKGKVAVERGPFVYALETMDTPTPLDEVVLRPGQQFQERKLKIQDTEVVALQTGEFQLVPYFAWGNRKPGEGLRVWINKDGSA